jgi:hypothetical protein
MHLVEPRRGRPFSRIVISAPAPADDVVQDRVRRLVAVQVDQVDGLRHLAGARITTPSVAKAVLSAASGRRPGVCPRASSTP